MGTKVARPVHPTSFLHPVCLMLPTGFCWFCSFYKDPHNEWINDCPKPPEGVQLANAQTHLSTLPPQDAQLCGANGSSHLFIPAGHLEHEGVVFYVEPGACIDSGGTWVVEPSPGGCDISMDALANADLSKAVLDNVIARDPSSHLAPAGSSEHEHFVSNVGFLTFALCAFIFFIWAKDLLEFVHAKRWVRLHDDTSVTGPVVEETKEKGDMVDEDRNGDHAGD
ncbi:uncharacterized protein N0V89_007772 [Didymosphaeria variabile]|uniref:Uncharacterized protein n=1 Tax=Didymosphaeria variabile TaxID=1932322 RepID=A0A9W8XK09_9PLEO|nr:uncharacterized protein N0V89_007772 [Didymosphaeria variabile]KAJ4352424.1 hypothetical protein N0V89_007772 [Didymosphaeria variabile]